MSEEEARLGLEEYAAQTAILSSGDEEKREQAVTRRKNIMALIQLGEIDLITGLKALVASTSDAIPMTRRPEK